jgi:predicted RNA-binding protein associated with RNAse of E/G family
MLRLFAAVALALLPAPAIAEGPPPSRHIARIMARADGGSPETAYRVSSVRDEYEIVRALGLEVKSQALVFRKKPYDILTVVDPKDGSTRDLWFDIGKFFGKF